MPIHNYPSIRAVPVLLLINDPLAPPQAWVQFADRLEDLAQPEKLESALSCLNLLVTDALKHVPDVLTYLARLRNQSIFNFCAIPQVEGGYRGGRGGGGSYRIRRQLQGTATPVREAEGG